MDASLLLAEKIAASASIGLLIGLEREWAHKETGVRSFAIATLLGTLAWLVSPTFAVVEVSVILVIILLVNIYSITQDHSLQVTTSIALAATHVLGVLVGAGNFFLAFGCAPKGQSNHHHRRPRSFPRLTCVTSSLLPPCSSCSPYSTASASISSARPALSSSSSSAH